MKERQRMEQMLQAPRETPEICMHCRYFYRHYLKTGRWYSSANYGHCTKPRLKIKKTYDTCELFEMRKE